ncbi:hypothetical protein IWQ60_005421 [Tieghemiomyces parasiticus]|uniref:SH3 domain-containing protein n=1 Tax=Tieghemiomyces parasiticus TaxID=78921 RepID=A0A9W8DT31_9FUNG|nr:hypothetical protein IWQ60_005421 [Tieghemiomyces parasiticus]
MSMVESSLSPPPAVDGSTQYVAKAVYTFQGEQADDLRFERGDLISIRDCSDPNWWVGSLINTERVGRFPSCLVRIAGQIAGAHGDQPPPEASDASSSTVTSLRRPPSLSELNLEELLLNLANVEAEADSQVGRSALTPSFFQSPSTLHKAASSPSDPDASGSTEGDSDPTALDTSMLPREWTTERSTVNRPLPAVPNRLLATRTPTPVPHQLAHGRVPGLRRPVGPTPLRHARHSLPAPAPSQSRPASVMMESRPTTFRASTPSRPASVVVESRSTSARPFKPSRPVSAAVDLGLTTSQPIVPSRPASVAVVPGHLPAPNLAPRSASVDTAPTFEPHQPSVTRPASATTAPIHDSSSLTWQPPITTTVSTAPLTAPSAIPSLTPQPQSATRDAAVTSTPLPPDQSLWHGTFRSALAAADDDGLSFFSQEFHHPGPTPYQFAPSPIPADRPSDAVSVFDHDLDYRPSLTGMSFRASTPVPPVRSSVLRVKNPDPVEPVKPGDTPPIEARAVPTPTPTPSILPGRQSRLKPLPPVPGPPASAAAWNPSPPPPLLASTEGSLQASEAPSPSIFDISLIAPVSESSFEDSFNVPYVPAPAPHREAVSALTRTPSPTDDASWFPRTDSSLPRHPSPAEFQSQSDEACRDTPMSPPLAPTLPPSVASAGSRTCLEIAASLRPAVDLGDRALDLERYDFGKVDRYARHVRYTSTNLTPELLSDKYLTRPFATNLEKLRAIFVWIVVNVTWDHTVPASGDDPSRSLTPDADGAPAVLQRRRCRQEGFANLFRAMAGAIDVDAPLVSGYVRGPLDRYTGHDYPGPNQSWNVLRLESGEYRFVDCGAAALAFFKSQLDRDSADRDAVPLDDFYFLTRPEHLVCTHFPVHPDHQFLQPPLTLPNFWALPYLRGGYFRQRVRIQNFAGAQVELHNDDVFMLILKLAPGSAAYAEVEIPDKQGRVVSRFAGFTQCLTHRDRRLCKIMVRMRGNDLNGVLKVYAGDRAAALNHLASVDPARSVAKPRLPHTPVVVKIPAPTKLRTVSGSSQVPSVAPPTPATSTTLLTRHTFPLAFALTLHHQGLDSARPFARLHLTPHEFYLKAPVRYELSYGQVEEFHVLAVNPDRRHMKLQLLAPSQLRAKFVYQPLDQSYILRHSIKEYGEWQIVYHTEWESWLPIVTFACPRRT